MASKQGPQVHEIDLTKLNLQQLTQIKQQLDQELNVYQDSLQTLKVAQTKFQDSADSVEKVTPDTKGKSVMVPLTASMYVPGKIADSQRVIIDIGTGYYIQKHNIAIFTFSDFVSEARQLDNTHILVISDIAGAKDYFKRKVIFVTEQMEKIQVMGLEKNKIREAVMDVMEVRLQTQLGAQQQQLQQRQQATKT